MYKKMYIAFAILMCQIIFAQEKKVTGTVTDDVEPLPGVSILVKGTIKGVETDFDGNYSIVVKQGDVLVFSFVGMETVEKTVGTSNKINVVLKSAKENVLEEVVVTGITKTDKRLFTGASTKLKADNVKVTGVADVSRALEGKAAGVSVQNVSGTFGSSPKIQVRGATSIYGDSKPLWVVDGVVMEDVVELGAGDLATGDPVTLISSAISGLSSEDIESFEILKDGSATSIYGARAMAGVIVITTKKGKAGTNNFNYSYETTYRFRPYYGNYNIMNSQEQMGFYEELRKTGWLEYERTANARYSGVYGKMYQMLNEVDGNGNFILPNTPKAKQNFLRKAEMRNTNWFEQLFTPNLMQNHALSWSSGTDRATYYASLSAMIDPGYSLQSKVNRYTANFNTTFKVTDKLKFGIISNGSYRKQRAPGALRQARNEVHGEIDRVSDINPYLYALNTSRTLDKDKFYTTNYAPFNIFNELENNYMDFNVVDLRFQTDMNYKFSPQIEFNVLGALKYSNSNIDHHATEFSNLANAYRAMGTATIRDKNPFLYRDPDDPTALPISILPKGGIYKKKNYSMLSYDFRATGSYKNTFDDHTVNFYAGMEVNKTDRNFNRFTAWGMQYKNGETPFYNTDYFEKELGNNNYYYQVANTRYRNVAFFSNATYSWKHKYNLNGTLRYEGTNKLGKSRSARWLPTWNVSGSWNVDREDFFESLKPLSHLTLKASYSLTADRGPSWVTNSLADIRAVNLWRPFDDVRENRLKVVATENSELTYEKKKELNLGMDLGLLNNKVNLVVDWYKRDNYDLIGTTVTQGVGGETFKYGNVASMKSSGLEVALNTTNIKNKDFSWTTSFVYSKTNSEITKLDNAASIFELVNGRSFVSKQGYPVGALFSVPFKGLNSVGLPTFEDAKGNVNMGEDIYLQERDAKNMEFLEYSGSTTPTDIGSLGNMFKYKNLSLNVFLTYSFGNVVRLNPVFKSAYSDLTATPKELKNRWSAPGDEQYTNIPAIAPRKMVENNPQVIKTAYNLYNYSTARVAKGDFVRMKEISLGYDFDKNVLNNLGMKKLSLKLQFTNPFLIYYDKKLNGQDPEFYNSGGVAMPVPKQLTFSIKARL